MSKPKYERHGAGRYRIARDADGIPIHDSPPVTPWCPAIYEDDNGEFVFVGKNVDAKSCGRGSVVIASDESAIVVSRNFLVRICQKVLKESGKTGK